MIKIYRNMTENEWFDILKYIQENRSLNTKAKMNKETYKIFEYLKAKHMGCFYHIDSNGNFASFNEYISLKKYEILTSNNQKDSACAMISGCKITIDETMVNQGEIILVSK